VNLIDRDALREALAKFHVREAKCELYFGESETDIIAAQPVVRCRDCKYERRPPVPASAKCSPCHCGSNFERSRP